MADPVNEKRDETEEVSTDIKRQWESLDYCLSKEVLEEGDEGSDPPRFGARGSIEIIGDLEGINLNVEEMSKILKSRDFKIGWADLELDKSLDKLLMTMHVGEKASIKVRVQNEDPPHDFTLVECVLKLATLENVDPIYKWSPEVKFERAQELYQLAVDQFKAGSHEEAFLKFRLALTLVTYVIEGESYEEKVAKGQLMEGQRAPESPTAGLLKDKAVLDSVHELKVKCLSNLSLCQMKFDNFDHVVQLTKELSDVKALYRRGVAHSQLGDFDDAIETFEKALTLEPSNKAVLNKLSETKVNKARSDAKLQQGLKKMFS